MHKPLRLFKDAPLITEQIPEPVYILAVEVHHEGRVRFEMALDRLEAGDLIMWGQDVSERRGRE